MAEFDNTNRGVLFVNERKQNDRQPDYNGSLNVDGVEYFLDAWSKTAKNGAQMLSVSIKRKEKQSGGTVGAPVAAKPAPIRPQPVAPKSAPWDGDDIPF